MFDTGVILTCLRDSAGFTRVFRTIGFFVVFLVCHTGLIPEFYTRAILVLISFFIVFYCAIRVNMSIFLFRFI